MIEPICPHCKSKNVYYLYTTTHHERCGNYDGTFPVYKTKEISFYQCKDCKMLIRSES